MSRVVPRLVAVLCLTAIGWPPSPLGACPFHNTASRMLSEERAASLDALAKIDPESIPPANRLVAFGARGGAVGRCVAAKVEPAEPDIDSRAVAPAVPDAAPGKTKTGTGAVTRKSAPSPSDVEPPSRFRIVGLTVLLGGLLLATLWWILHRPEGRTVRRGR